MSKCTFTIQTVYQYAPRRSIIITPSTPLCADIREIVSSISAAVDSVVVVAIFYLDTITAFYETISFHCNTIRKLYLQMTIFIV